MDEIISNIIAAGFSSQFALYIAAWCFVCALFTALAPEKLTSKIPNIIMTIINISAINVGKATNLLTNKQGNSRTTTGGKTNGTTGISGNSSKGD